MKSRLLLPALSVVVVVAFIACGKKKPPANPEPPVAEVVADAGPPEDAAPPAPKPLYERLGGADGVKGVVDSFVENVAHDPKINAMFKKTTGPKLVAFKKNLNDQLCEVTGGTGCKYAGKDMKTAHKGLKITDAQFDALVADLKTALDEKKVGADDQAELLKILAPLKEDIVEKKGGGKDSKK